MYKSFDELYSQSYIDFYNTCQCKDTISASPIPYIIDESLKADGQHDSGTVILKSADTNTPGEARQLASILYHEFTHYYDESMFKRLGYSDEAIKILMLTYSEIHAAYNGMFMFFNLRELSVKQRIDINKVRFKNHTMAEHIAFQIAKETQSMNDVLGFKNAMYLLGEKRAMLKIARDVPSITRVYNFKCIPKFMRDEIINIDKLIDLSSHENIDVEQININRLKIEAELRRISVKNIPIPDIDGMEDIRNIVDSL